MFCSGWGAAYLMLRNSVHQLHFKMSSQILTRMLTLSHVRITSRWLLRPTSSRHPRWLENHRRSSCLQAVQNMDRKAPSTNMCKYALYINRFVRLPYLFIKFGVLGVSSRAKSLGDHSCLIRISEAFVFFHGLCVSRVIFVLRETKKVPLVTPSWTHNACMQAYIHIMPDLFR